MASIARKLVTKSNATMLARFMTTGPRSFSQNYKDLLKSLEGKATTSEELTEKLEKFLDVAEDMVANGSLGPAGDVMLKRGRSLGYMKSTKCINTNASQILSDDGLEVYLDAVGFKKHNLQMLGEGNTLYVTGMAATPLGLRLIHDEVKVDTRFLYDAHNAVAELDSGVLKVKLPSGTKETMVAEPFPIKWV